MGKIEMPDAETERQGGAGRVQGQGRAYGRPTPTYDAELVQCGPGTPGGELLRRYWQPVAASSDVSDVPRAVRVFGEDLILYRDGSGRPGLLYPRCAHRGASLLYGKVEPEGIAPTSRRCWTGGSARAGPAATLCTRKPPLRALA